MCPKAYKFVSNYIEDQKFGMQSFRDLTFMTMTRCLGDYL